MVIAVAILVWYLNIWGEKWMPLFQNIMFVIHIFGFLAIIIVFWVLSPRLSAKATFVEFTNSGGWNSMGLSLMVGQVSAIYACICMYHQASLSTPTNHCRRHRCCGAYV